MTSKNDDSSPQATHSASGSLGSWISPEAQAALDPPPPRQGSNAPWSAANDPWQGKASVAAMPPLQQPFVPEYKIAASADFLMGQSGEPSSKVASTEPALASTQVAADADGPPGLVNMNMMMQQFMNQQKMMMHMLASQQQSGKGTSPTMPADTPTVLGGTTVYSNPAAIPTANVPSMKVSQPVLDKLIGNPPDQGWYTSWNNGGNGGNGKDEPIPIWDGTAPAKNFKPWLRDLRIWRHETNLPLSKHGLKLAKSFKYGSWMKAAADRIPEEQLVTEQAWGLILTEILTILKPYLDVETDVMIEELLFSVSKESKETMQNYVTRAVNKYNDLCAALGYEKITCPNCTQMFNKKQQFPELVWTYLLKRGGRLTDEQRKLIHQWDATQVHGQQLVETLLRLDRTDTLVAQSISAGKEAYRATYYGDSTQASDKPHVSDTPYSANLTPDMGVSCPPSMMPQYMTSFLTKATQDGPQDSAIIEDEDSEDDVFDEACYDDDGAPLIDEAGNLLLPMDTDREYQEEEANFLLAFAGTYREVRGQLQATRVGRDQKIFQKKTAKGSGKSFVKKPRFFKPGQAPKKTFPERQTPFKGKNFGKPNRGTPSEMLARTKCFRCGKLGHMSRNCTNEPVKGGKGHGSSAPPGKSSFFQFQSTPLNCYKDFSVGEQYMTMHNSGSHHAVDPQTRMSKQTKHRKCLGNRYASSLIYVSVFAGLMTLPTHALVDTGAQDGVIGLWHFQRWIVCLAVCHNLQPQYLPLPNVCETGGIGGASEVLRMCDMPVGIAGLNGVSRWVVIADPINSPVPPLIPINLMKQLDCVHEVKPLYSR